NDRGSVEYVTDIEILRPADRSKGNGILFFNVVNRGNKGGLSAFNADVPVSLPKNTSDNNAVRVAGDGFMMKHGYTIVWFGWQGRRASRKQPHDIHRACSQESGRFCDHRSCAGRDHCSGAGNDAQFVQRLVHPLEPFELSDYQHRQLYSADGWISAGSDHQV